MAINKNFVVKNGLEVDTSLILANANTNRVGIATTNPQHTLHVNGGIGAGGGNFFPASTREIKKNIEPFTKSALDIINSTDIVSFEFEQGGLEGEIHIGFIAEDTPEELATSAHDQIVIPSSLGILMKALQELDEKLQILENNA